MQRAGYGAMVAAGRHSKGVGKQRKGTWKRLQSTASGNPLTLEGLGSPKEGKCWLGRGGKV